MISGRFDSAAGALEYVRWGASDEGACPILLLHEGLGSVRLWKQFPEHLAAAVGREVIAWSRPGHGWSEGTEVTHELDYINREADLLPLVHKALGLERAHWLGHSDGGSIALVGAARYPHLAASLILEAPHVYVEKLTASSIAQIAEGFDAANMGERMKRYHRDPVSVFKRWSSIWLEPAFLDWSIENLLPTIAAPALLIQGRDDQYGTMDQLDRIAAVLPDTVRLELENCRHSPHFDREQTVISAICEFLRGKE